jgi:hypothetical protein
MREFGGGTYTVVRRVYGLGLCAVLSSYFL